MTPLQLQSAARNRYNAIGDPFYSNDFINNIILEACTILTNEGFVLERKYSTTSVKSQREYAYPSNATAIRRVEYNGVKLLPTYLEKDPKTSNTEPSGTPTQYAIWNREMVFFPTPDSAGDTITVYTYNTPQEITDLSVLEVPEEYHPMMVNFICAHMAYKDTNNAKGTNYMNLWQSDLDRAKRQNAKRKYKDEYQVVRDEAEQPAHPGVLF